MDETQSKRRRRSDESSYASRLFSGRLSEKDYRVGFPGIVFLGLTILGWTLVGMVVVIFVAVAIFGVQIEGKTAGKVAAAIFYIVFSTTSIFYTYSILVRRGHDFGRSGRLIAALTLIPVVNLMLLPFLLPIWLRYAWSKGDPERNEFGEPITGAGDYRRVFGIKHKQDD